MTLTALAREQLISQVGSDRVLTRPEDLIVHGYDGTWLERMPDAVVAAIRVEDVIQTIRVAREYGIAVVPRGAGSGLAGGSVPTTGGIVLTTNRMNRILQVDRDNLTAVVEAGVVNASLQTAVERLGLFYPPDPASLNQATIGGNAATSAGGPRCLKYGGTKDYVIGLDIVLPSGDVARLGSLSHQPTDDQWAIRAVVGSEGTLGVITSIAVRLLPLRLSRGTVMATFADLESAGLAVRGIIESGVIPLALELMDRVTLRCVEEYLHQGLPLDCEAMLLIDVDGEPLDVADQVSLVVTACEDAHAASVRRADSSAEGQQLWRARRSTSSSFGRIRPNKLGEDISVPRAAIPEMVRAVQAIAEEHRLLIPLFGHIGDGNLHPNILCDLRDREEMGRVALAARAIFEAAIARGGVISGEHGIGVLKREFLPASLDQQALELMRGIKRAVDPAGLLNDGKLF